MTFQNQLNLYWKHFVRIALVENVIISIFSLLRALIPTVLILYTAKFIDVAIAVSSGQLSSNQLKDTLFKILSLLLLQFIAGEVIKGFNLKRDQKVRAKVKLSLMDKRETFSFESIDNESFWKEMAVIEKDPEMRLQRFVNHGLTVLDISIRIIGFTYILSQYIWWMSFLVLSMSYMMFKLSSKLGQFDYEAFEEAEMYYHRASYFENVISSKEASEERTLFQFQPYINQQWDAWYKRGVEANNNALKKLMVRMSSAHLISKSIAIVIALLLLLPLKLSAMTAGVYMSLLGNAFFLVDFIARDLVEVLKTQSSDYKFIKRYINHLESVQINSNVEVSNEAHLPDANHLVVFDNVSFRYPESDVYILKNVSFTFKVGRRYALVGENGAGKSTLVKLMLGLYTSYEGHIYVNGVDLKLCSRESISEFYSVAFQDFSAYEISIREFLNLGNASRRIGEEALYACLTQMGLDEKVNELPYGIDTSLGKLSSESATFSGGQLQKLVVGRTLLKKAPFTILDEPTASIDPIQERALYKLFMQTEKSQTALIITHRLGAAVTADEILVLENGNISECGNHHELIEMRKTYFNLYEAQKGWYHA